MVRTIEAKQPRKASMKNPVTMLNVSIRVSCYRYNLKDE